MATKTSKNEQEKFTALVYFHGMGEQKRYEEVSQLVDQLNLYHQSEGSKPFSEEEIKALLELSNTGEDRSIGYINLKLGKGANQKNYRFYEAYWADITASRVPTFSVISWLFKQSFMPIKALLSPWREMTRLRRSILLEGWPGFTARKKAPDLTDDDLKAIFKIYDNFDSLENRKIYPKGRFADFRELIEEYYSNDDKKKERILDLAISWKKRFRNRQFRTFAFLVTIWLAIFLVASGVTALVGAFLSILYNPAETLPAWLATLFDGMSLGNLFPGWLVTVLNIVKFLVGENAIRITLLNAALLGFALVVLPKASYFLQSYMGDTYFWVTYEETSEKHQKRDEILKRCGQTLKQILLKDNKNCERVILVAHSLGTTIAYDTILELSRYNRALPPNRQEKEKIQLHKIEHFITLASPIDKIHYFFENQRSKSYQYLRVVEEIRGDVSSEPFADPTNKSLINWVNFWDKADVISGSLQTIGSRKNPIQNIRNQEVRSYLFPDPAGAHLAYFENKNVIKTIYRAIFDRGFTSRDFSMSQVSLRPTLVFQILLLATPWLISIYWILSRVWEVFYQTPDNNRTDFLPLQIFENLLNADVAFLIVGFGISWYLKHLDKLDE